MKRSIHKKLLNAYWLGEKEAEILQDAVPWPENDEPSDIEITVPVGPPYEKEPGPWSKFKGPYFETEEGKFFEPRDLPEEFVKMWVDRNRLRVDAVLHINMNHIITEVTPTMGAGSTGKVQLYVDLYQKDTGIPSDLLQPCIIGREYHESTKWYCDWHGIWLGVVPEGGPLEWIVHHA